MMAHYIWLMRHESKSKSNPHTFVERVELRQQQIVPDGSFLLVPMTQDDNAWVGKTESIHLRTIILQPIETSCR